MKTAHTIRSLVFASVFLAVMSVSFLVEARDIPEGATVPSVDADELVGPQVPVALPVEMDDIENGVASWYGPGFHGRRTASGRRYDMNELTAAHKNLPFGTLVRVQNATTGEAVVVEITDRGPYIKPRVLDLSKAAARAIGVGVTRVELEGIKPESMREFYLDNDSTVITITPDFQIVEIPYSSLKDVRPQGTYAKAVKSRRGDEVVVVLLDAKARPTYAVAEPAVLDLQIAATELASVR